MVELVERGVSLADVGPALLGMWEEELDAAAAVRNIPRALLLQYIIHEWLQQQQRRTHDAALCRCTCRTERDHLRARVLARIADRHAAHRRVTITGLANRFGLATEATQAILAELVIAGLITATLEPTTAGKRYLREYHGINE